LQIKGQNSTIMTQVYCKRVYLPASDTDGFRVLVDRLWPRGIKKENAHVDMWAKALAPSTELRKWFGHDPERFEEFARRYEEELSANAEAGTLLKEIRTHDVVTLLFGAKDENHNNAVVLSRILQNIG
jgi:uncharacterized protein YeaO (DUF488 family)